MIRAEGAAAVARRLSDIAEAIPRSVTAALNTEAEALRAEAKRRCPVQTGALKQSIHADVTAKDTEASATVGSDLPYAAVVELGTVGRPPQAYLEPALRARKSTLTKHIQQAVAGAAKGKSE